MVIVNLGLAANLLWRDWQMKTMSPERSVSSEEQYCGNKDLGGNPDAIADSAIVLQTPLSKRSMWASKRMR